MKGRSHLVVTQLALALLGEIDNSFPLLGSSGVIAIESEATDIKTDLELVDVEGMGRDDPHNKEPWVYYEDIPHWNWKDFNFTCFNHFIDIKKGKTGKFDDWDGYSYEFGSASKDQFQNASEVLSGWAAEALKWISSISRFSGLPEIKVDEGINWWLNDEYVHAPGQRWYISCSPSVARYSFYRDLGIYDSLDAEAKKRFPLAESSGESGKGIPYSVFMPVDNMARFWFAYYLSTRPLYPNYLGRVMHAIQDASIPHHAAGYCGNWHSKYEEELDNRISSWVSDPNFRNDVKSLFSLWCEEGSVKTDVVQNDLTKVPGINWRIDALVTWLALNAYHEYDVVYNHFRNGYVANELSRKNLTKKAVAMSMLALVKAVGWTLPKTVPKDESWFWLLFN